MKEREGAQDRFMGGAGTVAVATNAVGLGIDERGCFGEPLGQPCGRCYHCASGMAARAGVPLARRPPAEDVVGAP